MKKIILLMLSLALLLSTPLLTFARENSPHRQHSGRNYNHGNNRHQRSHNHYVRRSSPRNYYVNHHRRHYSPRYHRYGRDYYSRWGWGTGMLTGFVIGSMSNAPGYYYSVPPRNFYDNRTLVYSNNQDYFVQEIPGPLSPNTQCRKVTRRVWNKGNLVSETTEEICEGNFVKDDY